MDGFEEFFVSGPAADLHFEFRADASGNLRSHGAAERRIEGVAALEKRFDQV